jgi:hypothetical protein
MLTKIKRQIALEIYPKFPLSNNLAEEFIYPKVERTSILSIQAKSPKGHTKKLGGEIKKLCVNLTLTKLIFLGDTNRPWLYQQNDYKPANEAYIFLTENGIGKRFNGGLEIQPKDLEIFLYHFIWLTRCNASLPYFYFTDERQNILGHICQYGNVHLDILNKEFDPTLSNAIAKTDFEYFNDTNCYNQFSNYNRLVGRRIIV